MHETFQSTRPVRGATAMRLFYLCISLISIHAPRAGRDLCGQQGLRRAGISIHAPRAGRDSQTQTTWPDRANFNPRAPCGARRW